MSDCCHSDACTDTDRRRGDPAFKRVLWIVLPINAVMFLVEIIGGVAAGSASLQADALDFLGDTANYAISLFVVGMALRYRSRRRALLFLRKGFDGQALLDLNEALEIDPEDLIARADRALLQEQLGNAAEAQRDFNYFARAGLDPRKLDREAHINLAR